MAILLKGAPVAAALCEKTRETVSGLGFTPCLATVRVGENDADIWYEGAAIKRAASVGIATRKTVLPDCVSEGELLTLIGELNADASVHGVLIFRPLPRHISDAAVRAALAPEKDVDGITEASLGGVFTGSGVGFAPCTARSCMEILKYYDIPLAGRRAAVLGRSLVIGRPVSQLLMRENATVTVCHTRTRELAEELRRADIIVAAAGHAGAVGADAVREGQIIVDVGVNTDENGKMVGDVDFAAAEPVVYAVTPVPGGVGAVTTAVLAANVAEAAARQKAGSKG